MKYGRTFLLALLFSPLFALAAESTDIQFTPQQQDRILINDMLIERDNQAYEFSAVAYAVWGASRNYDNDPNTHVAQWDPMPSTDNMGNMHEPMEFPVSKQEFMKTAAVLQESSIQGFKVRGTVGEKIIEGAVGVFGTAAAPQLGAASPLVLPLLKEGVIRLFEIQPTDPNLPDEVTRAMWSWAMEEIRLGTEAGKILESHLNSRKLPDPREDRSQSKAVQAAQNQVLAFKNEKDVKVLIEQNKEIKETLATLNTTLEKQNGGIATSASDSSKIELPKDLDAANFFGTAATNLSSLSYILTLSDHAQEAAMVANFSRAASIVQKIAEHPELKLFEATNLYLSAAVVVMEALKITKSGSSPYPAIFEMLKQISKQIDQLRMELGTRMNQFDTKLSAMMIHSYALALGTDFAVDSIAKTLTGLQRELRTSEHIRRQQLVDLASLMLNAEDRECFQETGTGVLLPLTESAFIKCRDTYISRGTEFARSTLASGTFSQYYPYASRYESLRKAVDPDLQEYPQPLAQPAVWAQSSYLISKLAFSQPQYLTNFRTPNSPDLRIASLRDAGLDLDGFVRTLLFTEQDNKFSFRSERVVRLLDQAKAIQDRTVQIIKESMAKSGTPVNPGAGLDQPYNADYPYQVFGQPIPYCDDVKPQMDVIEDFVFSLASGCCGVQRLMSQFPGEIVYPLGHKFTKAQAMEKLRTDFAAMPAARLTWDRSLLSALSKDLVLMEQAGHMKGKITICISKLRVTRLNQKLDFSYQLAIDLGLRIAMAIERPEGIRTAVVQELSTETQVSGQGDQGFMFLHDIPKFTNLFVVDWPNFSAALIPKLQDVSSPKTVEVHSWIRNSFLGFLTQARAKAITPIQALIDSDHVEFFETIENLRAIFTIGADGGEESLRNWNRHLSEYANQSPGVIAQVAAGEPAQLSTMVDQMATQRQILGLDLEAIAGDTSLRPPQLFNNGLMGLRQIYLMNRTVKDSANSP